MELSYPEFKQPVTKAHHYSRGGYYKNWLDAPTEKSDTTRPALEPEEDQNDSDEEPEPAADASPDGNDDDEVMVDDGPARQDKGKGVDRGDKPPEQSAENQDKPAGNPEDEASHDIQILELHSQNPVISYRGRVFEGEWAEVIGTELILGDHKEASALPALRNLPGGVDLLAASSSRILTKEKILKPREAEEDSLARIRREWNIRIPVGKDKTGEKRQQTQFLENLIALKKKKGETDHVTVWALDGQGKDFRDDKDPDYKPRRKKPVAIEAKKKARGSSTDRRTGQRPKGRPRGSQARGDRPGTHGRPSIKDEATPAGESSAALSELTPAHWEDLTREKSARHSVDNESEASEASKSSDGDDDEDDGMT